MPCDRRCREISAACGGFNRADDTVAKEYSPPASVHHSAEVLAHQRDDVATTE